MLALLVVTVIAAVRSKDLFAAAILFGIYSFLTAILFMDLDAVDVAFTEAAVGAGVSTVLLLSTLRLTGRYEARNKHSPALPLLVVGLTGAALVYGMTDAPDYGDPEAPAHTHVAKRYIEQGPSETGVPNMVTGVLASYRGYDTLGEVFVVFTAALAVMMLLGTRVRGGRSGGREAIGDFLVLRVVGKVLIAFVMLFGLYVQFHGDYGAGGGFQAGVIFATALIVYDLVFGESDARRVMPHLWAERLIALGILFYLGTGVVSMLLGAAFLDYAVLADDPVKGEHLGILLVEFGIGVAVFGAVMSIFNAFSGLRLPSGGGREDV